MAKQLFTLPVLFPDTITTDSQVVEKIKLKLSSDLFYERTPIDNQKSIKFTANAKLPVIFMICTDNSKSKKLNNGNSDKLGKGKKGSLLSIPKLYQVDRNGTKRSYLFGKEGGEQNVDDAVVHLAYDNGTASSGGTTAQSTVIFSVNSSEILTVSSTSNESGDTGTRSFLKAEASNGNTVTVSIEGKDERGNVIVCVFEESSGNLLAKLNPKDAENGDAPRSYTADRSVYIIPFIRPSVSSNNGKDDIHFLVGDPKDNGSAESEEE